MMGLWNYVITVMYNESNNALVNVNSQGPPADIPWGFWHLRKCVVRIPSMGQTFLVINAFLSLCVYRFLWFKMPLDGCCIPNTCTFIQIQELEHVKDTQTNYFLSENPWVIEWGLTGSRWKRLKICNNSFRLGSEFPWVKMFLLDIPWVGQY